MKCVRMKMIVLTGIKEEGRLYRNDDKLRRVREMFSWLIVRTAVKIPFFVKDQTNTWSASARCWDYNIFHTTLTLRNLCKNLSLTLEHADYFLTFFLKTLLSFLIDGGWDCKCIYLYIYVSYRKRTKTQKTTKIACEGSWIFTFLHDTFESVREEVTSVFRLLRSHLNSRFFSFMISQSANFLTYFIMCSVKLKYLL